MKKALSILLSLLVVLAALPLTAVESFALTDGEWEYTVENNEATITRYTGTELSIIIPETLGGYTVTAIGEAAFASNFHLQDVIIPDCVVTVGDHAFEHAFLTSVSFGYNLTTIGNYAFNGCTSLANITLGKNVTDIGVRAFSSCPLSTVAIPAGIGATIGTELKTIALFSEMPDSDQKTVIIRNGLPDIFSDIFSVLR